MSWNTSFPADFKEVWVTDGTRTSRAIFWRYAARYYVADPLIDHKNVKGWSDELEPPLDILLFQKEAA